MRSRIRTAAALAALGGLSTALAIGLVGNAGGQGPDNGNLFAQLRGGHEVDDNGRTGMGDRQGHGAFAGFVRGSRLCYAITITGISDPVQAHVHRGRARSNGPVLITLDAPDAGNPGTSSACVSAPRRTLNQIQRSPGSFYVNVHTSDFPNGAARGQLFHPSSRQDR
jgi:CHRD domain